MYEPTKRWVAFKCVVNNLSEGGGMNFYARLVKALALAAIVTGLVTQGQIQLFTLDDPTVNELDHFG